MGRTETYMPETLTLASGSLGTGERASHVPPGRGPQGRAPGLNPGRVDSTGLFPNSPVCRYDAARQEAVEYPDSSRGSAATKKCSGRARI